jgi:dethiobiotin synthetase
MKTPIAVCAIDTGMGKSVVTGLLARHLLDRGRVVITQKPVQTGCSGRPGDILLHRQLMGADWHDLDEKQLTCSYCLPFPGSPHLAAQLAGTAIDPAVIDRATDTLAAKVDRLIIEAAGGLLVPLTEELLQLDFFAERGYPIILVTSPRLGSINHTLLSLEAIRHRNIPLLGLVYNLHGDHPREIVLDTLGVLRRSLGRYGYNEKIIMLPDMRESRAANWDILLDG